MLRSRPGVINEGWSMWRGKLLGLGALFLLDRTTGQDREGSMKVSTKVSLPVGLGALFHKVRPFL